MRFLILTLFISSNVLAANLDYSTFSGKWQLVPERSHAECALNYEGVMEFQSLPEQNAVYGNFPDGSRVEFHDINQGRKKFDSCFSDGILGYSETVGAGNKLSETVVYLHTGFFCGGGSEKSRTIYTWEIKGDTLTADLRSRIFHVGRLKK